MSPAANPHLGGHRLPYTEIQLSSDIVWTDPTLCITIPSPTYMATCP